MVNRIGGSSDYPSTSASCLNALLLLANISLFIAVTLDFLDAVLQISGPIWSKTVSPFAHQPQYQVATLHRCLTWCWRLSRNVVNWIPELILYNAGVPLGADGSCLVHPWHHCHSELFQHLFFHLLGPKFVKGDKAQHSFSYSSLTYIPLQLEI